MVNTIKKIFSINSVILLFAIVILYIGFKQLIDSFYDFKDLRPQKGIVANKYIFTENKGQEDSIRSIRVILTNNEQYVASRYTEVIDNLVQIGDTVQIFTKPITSKWGNVIANGKGDAWNTKDSAEIFHLISNKYESPLLSFDENKAELRESVWIWPVFSLCMFGWFFYRRSGLKSPFIIEHGG